MVPVRMWWSVRRHSPLPTSQTRRVLSQLAETTKEQNPALPVTPVEIADAACEACAAGAAVLRVGIMGWTSPYDRQYTPTRKFYKSLGFEIVKFVGRGDVTLENAHCAMSATKVAQLRAVHPDIQFDAVVPVAPV